jgi:hypothetical protein
MDRAQARSYRGRLTWQWFFCRSVLARDGPTHRGHAMTTMTQVLVATYETRLIHTVMQAIPTFPVDIGSMDNTVLATN